MSVEVWLAFFAACWVISLSPGAGAIASMASGMRHGFRRGYWNVLGLQAALVVQIGVVAAGVGAILSTSELAFNLIKWFGVAYLLYLAYRQWRAPAQAISTDLQQVNQRIWPMITRGFLVNISNPKAIVFMLAVLPQFLNPEAALLPQYGVMMLTMVAVDMIVMAFYTGLASHVLKLLKTPRQQKIMNRSFASMFAGAASLLALVHR
ncbi:LysE family transporter [Pokkaliibacter sp. CJK22405]|uniref:LysE family transporter n=1 Tax=Pokkaliibacter sp. CJK22405 TaxID=3384615 RepID=UPI00398468DB